MIDEKYEPGWHVSELAARVRELEEENERLTNQNHELARTIAVVYDEKVFLLARLSAAEERGQCGDCGGWLSEPGAPAICTAAHVPGARTWALDLQARLSAAGAEEKRLREWLVVEMERKIEARAQLERAEEVVEAAKAWAEKPEDLDSLDEQLRSAVRGYEEGLKLRPRRPLVDPDDGDAY